MTRKMFESMTREMFESIFIEPEIKSKEEEFKEFVREAKEQELYEQMAQENQDEEEYDEFLIEIKERICKRGKRL